METKKEEGITLVALILTVILLVILSLVGISVVYNSRLIEYAINGTMKYGQEGINENKILEGAEDLIESAVDNIKEIGKIPTPIITIPEANGENGWHNTEDITVTISDREQDIYKSPVKEIVYILDGTEVKEEGRTATATINTDGIHKIKAYATDGKNKRSEETEEYIIKRDVADPNKIELSEPTEVTTSSFKVTAVAQDITSGIKKIKFELSTEEDFSMILKEKEYIIETATTEERTQEHTFSGLNDGTPYYIRVIVTDEAGRTSTSSTVAQNTVVANTAPSKAQVSFNTKGTNYIKVNAKSEDIDGDKLTYTLRYGTSSSNLNYSTDLTNQEQNVQVSIQTPTNLSQYTYYYWRVDVSDGKATTEGDLQTQIRTYCPGNLRSCDGFKVICKFCKTSSTRPCSTPYNIGKSEDYVGGDHKCSVCLGYFYLGVYRYTINCSSCGDDRGWRNACSEKCALTGQGVQRTCVTKLCASCGRRFGEYSIKVDCDHSRSSAHKYCTHGQLTYYSMHD